MTELSHLARLTSTHGKALERERLLGELNALLAPLERDLQAKVAGEPRSAPVFVLGPPRGGTTLMSQLLAEFGAFGVVTNFVAYFWRAPALGLRLSRALGVAEEAAGPSYRSKRGKTDGWDEPSEFGYFWSQYFDLGQETHFLESSDRDKVDREGLRRAVSAMEAEAGKPMAFKNNTWFTFQADLLAEIFPGAVLVACRRDPYFVAQSLYLQRLDLYDDAARWWSVRPRDYERIRLLSPIQQVAEQAVRICHDMESSLARAQGATIIDGGYDLLTADPGSVVARIARAAGINDAEISEKVQALPRRFENTNTVRLPAGLADDLKAAIEIAQHRPEAPRPNR